MSQAIQLFNSNREKVYPSPYYPVGSIYMSVNNVNPANIFGGKWEQIKDKFLLGAGNSYSAGKSGGSATIKLETKHMPSHNHSGSIANGGGHTHMTEASFGTGGGDLGYASLSSVGNGRTDQLWRDGNARYGGEHSHGLTINNTGGNTAHDNMPPYLVVYMWKRVE